MARKRVLITGFGPFPGVPDNPSSWLAEALAEQASAESDAELHARVVPTEWRAAALMPDLYASLQPTLMIHFGLDQRAKALRLERHAHNRAAPRTDAQGAFPESLLIRRGGADRLQATLSVAMLATHLRLHGFPAVASRSAGAYLCNFLYYHSLEWAQTSGCHALFVHIPPVRGKGPFTKVALLRGADEILRFALNAMQTQAGDGATTGPAFAPTEAALSAKGA
jgi:pyroglutamyl-peptidase